MEGAIEDVVEVPTKVALGEVMVAQNVEAAPKEVVVVEILEEED